MAIDYNNPETWASVEIYSPPVSFNREAYQKRINDICGLAPNGKPNVRLTWGGEMEAFSKWFCEWNEAGFGTKTHLRAKYAYTTYKDKDIIIDIPYPRWVVEQRTDASRYASTDEQSRWKKVKVGQQVFVREVRPPRSLDGYYSGLFRIGKHTEFCCAPLKAQGLKCWGDYCEPGEIHLDLLRRAVKQREAENGQNPNAPLSNKTLQDAAREASEEKEEKRRKAEEILGNYVEENFDDLLAYMLGENPRDTNKFSIPGGYKKSESGLILPK